jgi:hypothetical protein
MKFARLLQVAVIAAGTAAAAAPWPGALVEEHFSRRIYPQIQTALTSWSNETSLALFDYLLITTAVVGIVVLMHGLRTSRRRRSLRPLGNALMTLAFLGAAGYLWFLGVWGLNYARVPFEQRIAYEPSRVTADGVRNLAERALTGVNQGHAIAHATGFPTRYEIPPSLVQAMQEVGTRLGRTHAVTPSRPKRTLLGPFFRAAGVDGMHAPFLLETLLNPDLTPPEQSAVLAHEWAHLAGHAPEADASFVGLLAALRADPASRYSAWFALFHEALALLPAAEQRAMLGRLEAGPRADREAMLARHRQRVDVVSRASWETYDRYLRAQGVEEGVRSYSRVVQLLLGTDALDW